MTNDLAQKYIDRYNLKIIKSESGVMDMFYPFLLMDSAYQIFSADIKPVQCRTEMKRCKNRLHAAYNSYWKRFFSVYNQEESDRLVDMMDGYSDYIHNLVVQMKVAAMNVIVQYIPDFESQRILAACFTSSTLAHCANTVNELIFKNSLKEDRKDHDITAVENFTRDFADWFIERNTACREYIPVGSDDAIGRIVDALVRKIARFPEILSKKKIEQN